MLSLDYTIVFDTVKKYASATELASLMASFNNSFFFTVLFVRNLLAYYSTSFRNKNVFSESLHAQESHSSQVLLFHINLIAATVSSGGPIT